MNIKSGQIYKSNTTKTTIEILAVLNRPYSVADISVLATSANGKQTARYMSEWSIWKNFSLASEVAA